MAVVFKVEAAFGHTFSETHIEGSTVLPGPAAGWVDISDYVSAFDAQRGRNNEFDEIETGTISIDLDNADGRFTPERAASPYYPNIVPGVPVRVTASADNWVTSRAVFYGHTEKWPVDLSGISTVSLTVSDMFAALSRQSLKPPLISRFLKSQPLRYFPLTPDYRLSCLASGVDATITGSPGAEDAFTWEAGTDRYAFRGDGKGVGLQLTTDTTTTGAYVEAAFDFADIADPGIFIAFQWFPDGKADVVDAPTQGLMTLQGTDSTASVVALLADGVTDSAGYRLQKFGSPGMSFGPVDIAAGRPMFIGYHYYITTGPDLWHEDVYICGPGTNGVMELVNADTTANWLGASTSFKLILGAYKRKTLFVPGAGNFAHLAIYRGLVDLAPIVSGYADPWADIDTDEVACLSQAFEWGDLSPSILSADPALSTRATLDWGGVKPALEVVREVGADSGGVVFPAADGRVFYKNRHARIVTGAPSTQFTTAANAAPEPDMSLFVDDGHIINDVTLKFPAIEGITTGFTARLSDEASALKFGRGTVDRDTQVTDRLEAADAAAWAVAMAANPMVRVEGISFRLNAFPNPDLLLSVDVGSRVRVEFPEAAPWPTKDFWIEGVALSVQTEGALSDPEITFKLSPANVDDGWILEDAVAGVLDSTARLVY